MHSSVTDVVFGDPKFVYIQILDVEILMFDIVLWLHPLQLGSTCNMQLSLPAPKVTEIPKTVRLQSILHWNLRRPNVAQRDLAEDDFT